jgi:hypothetical protein
MKIKSLTIIGLLFFVSYSMNAQNNVVVEKVRQKLATVNDYVAT